VSTFSGNPSTLWLAILAALCMACAGDAPPPEAGSILLARHPASIRSLELPPSSRPVEPPDRLRFRAPLTLERTAEGVDVYATRLPYQHVYRSHNNTAPPPHFDLQIPDARRWTYASTRDRPWTWSVTSKSLRVRVPEGTAPPDLTDWTARYAVAHESEARMALQSADTTPAGFALRQMRSAGAERFGVFLPAPATASFEVTVPRDAELSFWAGLLPAPLKTGLTSDGATLHVELLRDGQVLRERSCHLLEIGRRQRVRMQLSQYQGQTLQIRFRTDPGEDAHLDYVFLAEPALATRTWSPRRLVLLFADTLRPDHLGTYGHTRPTSPAIDALAAQSQVFEHARSISPWTLPAARAALTGRQPEAWEESERLPAILARNGWHTAAFVGNAFLSSEFDMGSDWGAYRYHFLARADETVDRAVETLSQHSHGDLALLLHFMEPHLPYMEKEPYRSLWAGEEPPGFETGVSLIQVDALGELTDAQRAEYARYLKDRYDQNIRAMDDQIGRLLDALPSDATVVLYSDHGEEFWEHGGFEHGHALWEEVVRVPLIIRSPHLRPGRVTTPVSLLDLTPTVLGALGIETDIAFKGRDLARNPTPAPVAIGRVLRGAESWAVVEGQDKWITRHGRHQRFDLEADPGETAPLDRAHTAEPVPEAALLAEAVERPVVPVLHVIGPHPSRAYWRAPKGEVALSLPGGFTDTWARGSLPTQEPRLDGDRAVLGPARPPHAAVAQEFFAVPANDSLEGLRLEIRTPSASWSAELEPGQALPLRAGPEGAGFEVRWDALPLPPRKQVPGTHPDRVEELRALGYTGD